ncbi:MAG: hypothetical protein JJU28_17520 [Cyclobacteriaceae bacterium]|nr:hypothetical protein [Cyclobacteriaceae bacterium]
MEVKICPFCSEEIKVSAIKCKHCGSDLLKERIETDKVYFQDDQVLISLTRFKAFNNTYAMKDITSVSLELDVPAPIIPFIIFIFAIFQAIFDFGFIEDWLTGYRYLDSCIIFIVGFFFLNFYKTKYFVSILNNSGQVKTITSENKEYIDKIVNSLNQAIIDRG